ncbi:MAG: hypothetical protein QXL94_03915 [Candidatus Parvarchaeum sp.]
MSIEKEEIKKMIVKSFEHYLETELDKKSLLTSNTVKEAVNEAAKLTKIITQTDFDIAYDKAYNIIRKRVRSKLHA